MKTRTKKASDLILKDHENPQVKFLKTSALIPRKFLLLEAL